MACTLLEVQQQRNSVKEELGAIIKSVELVGGKYTPEQRTKCNELLAKDGELKATVDQLAADAKIASYHAELAKELAVPEPRKTSPDSLAPRIDPVDPPAFKSFGEQLQAIANVGISGREDNRLHWENLAPSGAASGVPSDGGYLVQKDFTTSLEGRMYEIGQILQRVNEVPISANADGLQYVTIDETSRVVGSRWGGVQVYWGAEADSATAKKPKLRKEELTLCDLIGLAYVTNRLLQDASAMESIFSQAFSEEMSFVIEDAIINGDGAGKPLGIINAGCTASVAKETNQTAATIQYANVRKMWSRMWGRSRASAVWLVNQDAEPELYNMSMPIGTGGVPVLLPPGGLSTSPYATLYGRSVIPVEYCAAVGTTGDLILADFSQYRMIRKGGVQADSSVHVRFITNENTFRYIYRTAGQPLWSAALTPANGSTNTLSPFVKLDTRA